MKVRKSWTPINIRAAAWTLLISKLEDLWWIKWLLISFKGCRSFLLQKVTTIDFFNWYKGLERPIPETAISQGWYLCHGKAIEIGSSNGVVAAVEGVGHQLTAKHSDGKTLFVKGSVEHTS